MRATISDAVASLRAHAKLNRLIALLAAAAVVLVACGQDLRSGEFQGVAIDRPQAKPSFSLTDTSGGSYDLAAETRASWPSGISASTSSDTGSSAFSWS